MFAFASATSCGTGSSHGALGALNMQMHWPTRRWSRQAMTWCDTCIQCSAFIEQHRRIMRYWSSYKPTGAVTVAHRTAPTDNITQLCGTLHALLSSYRVVIINSTRILDNCAFSIALFAPIERASPSGNTADSAPARGGTTVGVRAPGARWR